METPTSTRLEGIEKLTVCKNGVQLDDAWAPLSVMQAVGGVLGVIDNHPAAEARMAGVVAGVFVGLLFPESHQAVAGHSAQWLAGTTSPLRLARVSFFVIGPSALSLSIGKARSPYVLASKF